MLSKLLSSLTRRHNALPAPRQMAPVPEPEERVDEIPETEFPGPDAAASDPVLIHREVLDSGQRICGIEFLIRGELRNRVATSRTTLRRFLDGMLIDQLSSLHPQPDPHRPPWIQLGEGSLLRLGISRLPPHSQLLLQTEEGDRPASPDIHSMIGALQAGGHSVWLDDALHSSWLASLAGAANGATLRMGARTPFQASELLQSTRKSFPHMALGAWDIATPDDFELARRLGCSHFSGSFVTHRGDWSANTISPQAMTVSMLINQLRDDVNFRSIANVLKRDMALSYRMLRYVNVAAHGLVKPISSIEQGLAILGQDQLDRWLTLLLLASDGMSSPAIAEIALTRARFLELVGAYRLPPEECSQLFTLGLFSMLDLALHVPLAAAIRPLNLAMPISAALLSRGGRLGAYLALADACDAARAEDICRYAVMLGLTTTKVSARRLEAAAWVAELTAQALTEKDPSPANC